MNEAYEYPFFERKWSFGYDSSAHSVGDDDALCAYTFSHNMYSKLSIIRPGRPRLLEFEKKIVIVV